MKKHAGKRDIGVVRNYWKLLLNQKAELEAALEVNSQQLTEKEEQRSADQEQLLQQESVCVRLNRVLYDELRQVEEALARLREGKFGFCLGCGNAIAPKRLEAVPWTRYCLLCQESAGSEPQSAGVWIPLD